MAVTKKMLDDGDVRSISELEGKESLTSARITQIVILPMPPDKMQAFLLGLDNPKDIRKFSERRLRGYHAENVFVLR
jgi:hypothetical protein